MSEQVEKSIAAQSKYAELPPPVRAEDLRTAHDVRSPQQPSVKSENDLTTEVGG